MATSTDDVSQTLTEKYWNGWKRVHYEKRVKNFADSKLYIVIRQRLREHFATLDRQHGRPHKLEANEAVYQDEAKEKRRLWNNYRSIISRQDRKDTLKWQDEMRNKTLNNMI